MTNLSKNEKYFPYQTATPQNWTDVITINPTFVQECQKYLNDQELNKLLDYLSKHPDVKATLLTARKLLFLQDNIKQVQGFILGHIPNEVRLMSYVKGKWNENMSFAPPPNNDIDSSRYLHQFDIVWDMFNGNKQYYLVYNTDIDLSTQPNKSPSKLPECYLPLCIYGEKGETGDDALNGVNAIVKGDYSATANYKTGDLVSKNHHLFLSRLNSVGKDPANHNNEWEPIEAYANFLVNDKTPNQLDRLVNDGVLITHNDDDKYLFQRKFFDRLVEISLNTAANNIHQSNDEDLITTLYRSFFDRDDLETVTTLSEDTDNYITKVKSFELLYHNRVARMECKTSKHANTSVITLYIYDETGTDVLYQTTRNISLADTITITNPNDFTPTVKVATPVQTNTLVYNEQVQTPVWSYQKQYFEPLSGQLKATEAGTYSTTFKLKNNATWEDGTTVDKTIPWYISKAECPIDNKVNHGVVFNLTDTKTKFEIVINSISDLYFYNYEHGLDYFPRLWATSGASNFITYTGKLDNQNKKYIVTVERTKAINTDFQIFVEFAPIKSYLGTTLTFNCKCATEQVVKQVATPVQTNKLVYNEQPQQPIWSYQSEGIASITGITEATDVGSYGTIFKLKQGYVWDTGTSDDKTISWTIDYAPCPIQPLLDPNVPIVIDEENKEYTLQIKILSKGYSSFISESFEKNRPHSSDLSDIPNFSLGDSFNDDPNFGITDWFVRMKDTGATKPVDFAIEVVFMSFAGYLAETLLYNIQLRTKNKPIVVDTNTLLYLKGNDFVDESAKAHTITNNGVSIGSGNFANSYQFNGNSRLTVDNANSTLTLGTSDWTIEWYEHQTKAQSGASVYKQYSEVNIILYKKKNGIVCGNESMNKSKSIDIFNGGANKSIGLTIPVELNKWRHVAIVRSGNNVNAYVNGTSVDSKLCDFIINESSDIIIGEKFNGYISHLSVSNIARYTETFTPPTYH